MCDPNYIQHALFTASLAGFAASANTAEAGCCFSQLASPYANSLWKARLPCILLTLNAAGWVDNKELCFWQKSKAWVQTCCVTMPADTSYAPGLYNMPKAEEATLQQRMLS